MTQSSMLLHLGKDSTLYNTFLYPGGETQVRLNEEGLGLVRSSDEIRVVARIRSAQDVIELALLVNAISLVRKLKSKVILYLPYLPYSRADRIFLDGDCHGLGVFFNILGTLNIDSIVTLDVHSSRCYTPKLKSISPDMFVRKAIFDAARRGMSDEVTLLFPDEGASLRYEDLAVPSLSSHSMTVKLNTFYASKTRNKITGKLEGFVVPQNMPMYPVLIIDDICDGGGTFIGIAKEIPNTTDSLFLYTTHGIFSRGFEELGAWFNHIYCTDSFRFDITYEYGTVYHAEDVLLRG